MSLTSLDNNIYNLTLDGLVSIDANQINIDGQSINPNTYVTYSGASGNVDLGSHYLNANALQINGSDVQTQLNTKASTSYVNSQFLDKVTGTTQVVNSTVNFNNGVYALNVQANTLTQNTATASTACVFDANKNVISSSVSSTELGYLSGATSNVQNQINTKGGLSSGNYWTNQNIFSWDTKFYDWLSTFSRVALGGDTLSITQTIETYGQSIFTPLSPATITNSGYEYTINHNGSNPASMRLSSYLFNDLTKTYIAMFRIKSQDPSCYISIKQNNVNIMLGPQALTYGGSGNVYLSTSYSYVFIAFRPNTINGTVSTNPVYFTFSEYSSETWNEFTLLSLNSSARLNSLNVLGATSLGSSTTANGNIDLGNSYVIMNSQPSSGTQGANKNYVDGQTALKVSKSGDTMSGALAMGANKITSSYVPVNNDDICNKLYVDLKASSLLSGNNTWTGVNTFNQAISVSPAINLYGKLLSVGGSATTFYPVVFDTSPSWETAGKYYIGINRGNVHQDASWKGSITSWIEGHNTSWGNGADYISWNVINSPPGGTYKRFIANIIQSPTSTGVIVWLRGATTYYYNCIGASLYFENSSGTSPYTLPIAYNESYSSQTTISTGFDYLTFQWDSRNEISSANANVGIGTGSPSTKLRVSNGSILLDFGRGIGFHPGTTDMATYSLHSVTSDPYALRMALDSDGSAQRPFQIGYYTGNVSSGTWNTKFSVNGYNGNTVVSGNVDVGGIINMGQRVLNRLIILYNETNNDHQFYGMGINGGTFRFQIASSGAAFRWFRADSTTASTEIMTLDGDGVLTVASGLHAFSGTFTGSVDSGGSFRSSSTDTSTTMRMNANDGTYGLIDCYKYGDFATKRHLSLQPYGGNVGIGTTAPNAKLTISSSTADYTNSLRINTGWPSVYLDGVAGGGTGRDWVIINGGYGAGIGRGNFGIFDATAPAYRYSIDSGGTSNFQGNAVADVTTKVFVDYQGAWGGGLNTTYAFYKSHANSKVLFTGYATGYNGGAQSMSIRLRIYSRTDNAYYYSYVNTFTNNAYNHVSYPITAEISIGSAGWYDFYIENNTGFITDQNDYVRIAVTILPRNSF